MKDWFKKRGRIYLAISVMSCILYILKVPYVPGALYYLNFLILIRNIYVTIFKDFRQACNETGYFMLFSLPPLLISCFFYVLLGLDTE